MKFDAQHFHCGALSGRVRMDAPAGLAIEPLFLGGNAGASWADMRNSGSIRFEATDVEAPASPVPEICRDFGDSHVQCASNACATVRILPDHAPPARQRLPAALAFAFAHQWARLGHLCVHGALLRVSGEGVLVLGIRAAGKSVLSASALMAGGQLITDDHVIVGIRDGHLVGERIRSFFSLRASWASDALTDGSGEWKKDRTGRRAFLRVSEEDPRFPEHTRIDRLWILSRPREERRESSSISALSHAEAYGAIVTAIQPLLLGAEFPHESAKIHSLIRRMISGIPAARIETGQDIVLSPQRSWRKLLEASMRATGRSGF